MKKFTAFLIILVLIFPCVSVAAAEEETPEYLKSYDCILGEVGSYMLAYKAPDTLSENDNYVTWGVGYFCIKCENIPLYLVNENEEVSLQDSYPDIVGDELMKKAVELTAQAIENKEEPLINGITSASIINENTEDTTSAEETETSEPENIVEEETEKPTEAATHHDPMIPATEAPTEGKETPQNETEPPEKINSKPVKEAASASFAKKPPKLNITTATLKCGKTIDINVKNKYGRKVIFSSGNKKTAVVNKKGIVTTLKKGRAKITAKVGKKKLYCIVKVVTSPKLSESTIKVRKGAVYTVKVYGRAKSVKNKYKSTSVAKITSPLKADRIKIQGIRKGKTTLKIKVNGVLFNIKVKVI